MEQVGISSLKELSNIAGVSERQLYRLQAGLLPKMDLETLVSISQALKLPLSKLVSILEPKLMAGMGNENLRGVAEIKQEYQQLQAQMEQQKESLEAEFQGKCIKKLESWLLQWPTAVAAVEKNNELPAVRLLPLVKPVTELLAEWGVEAIASVGEEVLYTPQFHQLITGSAQIGDPVRVRYPGYRQGDKLLYRAQVSPV